MDRKAAARSGGGGGDDEQSTGRMLTAEKWHSCFLTTKHSWRGKYKRIFAIGQNCVATFNPQTYEETNRWNYGEEFVGIMPGTKAPNEFVISTKKKDTAKKVSTTTFSCEFRSDLLTDTQSFRHKFEPNHKAEPGFKAFKQHWSETRREVGLRPSAHGLEQIDPVQRKVIATYKYIDIETIYLMSDLPGGFALLYGGHGRMHVFALEQRDELLKKIAEKAATYIGRQTTVSKKAVNMELFRKHRLGDFQDDYALTSLAEFNVHKVSPRHTEPVARLLCLSETCILERDPGSYNVVCCRPLSTVYCLVRDEKDPQMLKIQYMKGEIRTYLSTDRDALLASVLDSVRANGNRSVSVQIHPTPRGRRYQPFEANPEEDIESHILKQMAAKDITPEKFNLAIRDFNCNVSYNGLVFSVTEEGWFKENKEKAITAAMGAILQRADTAKTVADLSSHFQAIRRLVASKAGFSAFTQLPGCKEKIGGKVIKALRADNEALTYAAVDVLCTLMQPMHENYDLAQEKQNKEALLYSADFINKLLALLKQHADRGTAALIVSALLDFFTFAVCAPYCETTDGNQFDRVLKSICDLGRSLFRLFEHPSMAIVKAAGLIMKAIIEEGDEDMCNQMQTLSLAEAALLRHMVTAMFTQSTDNRMLTHRQLSRHLVGLWMEKNEKAMELLRRMLPAGLIDALDSAEEVPEREVDRMHIRDTVAVAKGQSKRKTRLDMLVMHWRARTRKKPDEKKPVVLRRRRQRLQIEKNWEYFYYQFNQDHARADLIWNYKTREELREAMEGELRAFLADKDLRGKHLMSWNHVEFEVRYETLAEEIKIGDHYLRLLLDNDKKNLKIHNAPEFFNDLYHRFLLTTKPTMKGMCLQAMAIVYDHCHDVIGHFNDTEYIVHMLNKTSHSLERDRLLQFLDRLLVNKTNVKRFIDANGIKCLVNLVTLAHLDTDRATTPLQTAMIEASNEQLTQEEAEWYYQAAGSDGKKEGPFGFVKLKELHTEGVIHQDTKVWAQGMEGWRAMRTVPQLKWTLLAEGQAVLSLTQLAVLCLEMLIRICEYYPSRDEEGAIVRPVPRCKRFLSEPTSLPHIVQLLLTFQPEIVERVARLLDIIVKDNSILPRLYLTGVFYFIMMYTGSNLLPIARFLKNTHNVQAYKSDNVKGHSILATLLPVAMVCFLDNYGPDKFASIFLGEFDTPETIWGAEMRRLLIEKIALHLADFTPRLRSNTRAIYQFCPIPIVSYPQLEGELFCNIYYLRHLCDTQRFPDWEIKNHVELLKDILETWKVECEKKPSSMSVDEALQVLGLDPTEQPDSKAVRKAYFKMSMKYHPDKNPEGRDMFEKVNKAYEFISSKENLSLSGPSTENIVLIIRAQSILFSRYPDVLKPYKYAGYPMLISTIEQETKDENLFASSVHLLEAACELSFHTVNCSPLNAEELRREGGLETLSQAMSRCISVVSRQTSTDEPAVRVCIHILRTYAAAASFDECRERITEIPEIVRDTSRCLWLKGSPELTLAAIDCVCEFSVDSFLQNHLLQAGALWHLIVFLFGYDYTLDESGVEKDEKTHQQEFVNKHAKIGVKALARLGGFRASGPDATPENPTIRASLTKLLTPFLAEKLCDDDPVPLLKLFNDNTECPYLIWDGSTRAELMDFVEQQQEQVIKTGEQDEEYGQGFVYSAHKDELIVADIFVRVYNEQPTFNLRQPKHFAASLIDFIGSKAQYLWSARDIRSKSVSNASDDTSPDAEKSSEDEAAREANLQQTRKELRLALEALRNVITAAPGAEETCNSNFNLLFSLLRYNEDEALQLLALEVLTKVTGNATCVAHIAKAKVLVYLLFSLHTLPKGRLLALEVLHAVVSNNKCIVELMQSGGLIYLLDLFCSSSNPAVREATAALFAKMLGEKLHGPRVKLVLLKFLPPLFMEAVRDSPENSVTMFEGNHENPELIWDEDSRANVSKTIKELKEKLYEEQQTNPNLTWQLPEDFAVVYEGVKGEVVVGGVFLRLVIKQPTWQFRKPKEFLVAIMDRYMRLCTKEELSTVELQQLETVTDALCAIFAVQSELVGQVPALGHLGKLIKCLSRDNQAVQGSLIRVMTELASHQLCIRQFGSIETIGPLQSAMKTALPGNLAISTILVKRLYETVTPALVTQAIETKFVQFLLDLLKDGLDKVENPSASRANVVKALKQMTTDLGNGENVTAILDKCEWWAMYRDQRHDLFLTGSAAVGYLEGPATPAVAGYLMDAPTVNAATDTAPPPMADDDHAPARRNIVGDPDA